MGHILAGLFKVGFQYVLARGGQMEKRHVCLRFICVIWPIFSLAVKAVYELNE